jgi:serine phosphatase RsbU (regulator of sigma subunit)
MKNNPVKKSEYDLLRNKYVRLHKKNKDLLDSLYYAESVQRGILPSNRHLSRLFKDYFVFYQPQLIISGDLYWVARKDEITYFAVGDCTGHGISGAMLSIMALSYLNYIILAKNITEVSEVLKELDKKWIDAFHQGTEKGYDNDWMEIGICSYNEKSQLLKFSGAYNKLIIISSSGKIIELETNKFPIGGWQVEKERNYASHTIFIEKGSMCYLFSDGFKDQFGGEKRKRFTANRFKSLLAFASSYSSVAQLDIIKAELEKWKGKESQTDDICILGIRL